MGSVFQVGSDFLLNQGLASFFSKGPDNKYFRLVDHVVSVTYVNFAVVTRKQPHIHK